MKTIQILTSIIIMLMMAGSVSAAACPGPNSRPGNLGTASLTEETPQAEYPDSPIDVVGISVQNPDDPTQAAVSTSSDCNGQTQVLGGTMNWMDGEEFSNLYFASSANNGEYIVAVFNTQASPVGNKIVAITKDATTGSIVAARELTATTNDVWYANEVEMTGDGDAVIYGLYQQFSAQVSTFLIRLTPGAGVYTVDYIDVLINEAGTYNAQPEGLEINEDDNKAYIAFRGGNNLYATALNLANGAVSSTVRYPTTDSVTTGILNFGSQAGGPSTASLITIFYDSGIIVTGAITVDGSGDLGAANEVFTTGGSVTDYTLTGLTKAVVTEYGSVTAAGPCNDGIDYLSCILNTGWSINWAKRTSTPGMQVQALSIYTTPEEDEYLAVGAANGQNRELHSMYEWDGTAVWGFQKGAIVDIKDIQYVLTSQYGEYRLITTGKASEGSTYVELVNPYTGNDVAFDVFNVGDLNGVDQGGQEIEVISVNVVGLVSNALANIMILNVNYPAPAPEFSLTTLLLATLLAGGLVLFVVRRRYK